MTIFFIGWGQTARLQRVRQNTADRIQKETEQQQTARLQRVRQNTADRILKFDKRYKAFEIAGYFQKHREIIGKSHFGHLFEGIKKRRRNDRSIGNLRRRAPDGNQCYFILIQKEKRKKGKAQGKAQDSKQKKKEKKQEEKKKHLAGFEPPPSVPKI